jgi:ABC-2 type transport system permease protein
MRNLFPNAWHVARREYLQRVRTRTFAIVTAILGVVGLGLALLPLGLSVIAGDEATQIGAYAVQADVGEDPAGQLELLLNATAAAADPDAPARYAVEPVDDPEQARAQVRDGELDSLLTVSRDPDGELTFEIYTDASPTSGQLAAVRNAATQLSVADRLERSGLDPADVAGIFAPTAFEVDPVDPDARDPQDAYGARYLVATVLVVLTFMAIITYGTWVATSVAEEKSSRVMELLVTAATPRQLLAGKVIGNGAAGLTQYGVVLGSALIGLLLQDTLADRLLGRGGGASAIDGVDLTVLLPFGIFFIGGFLLYATLYAGLGSMASRQEDVQQATGPMLFVGMAGYFAAFVGLNVPDAAWVKIMSLVPFFSPYLLPARLVMDRVEPWEWLVAGVLLVLFLLGALWVAARIYSAGVLLYGQRPSLRNIFRAVRVDR